MRRQINQRSSLVDRRRPGAATLELALVLPLILLFGFAGADFGRIVHAYLAVSNAARAGAEYGSMHEFNAHTQTSWESQVRQAVLDEMQGLPSFSAANLQIEIPSPAIDGDGLAQVRVKVTYPFQMIVNWPGLPATCPLHHEVEMRQIR